MKAFHIENMSVLQNSLNFLYDDMYISVSVELRIDSCCNYGYPYRYGDRFPYGCPSANALIRINY